MPSNTFDTVQQKCNFSKQEIEILEYQKKIDAFRTSLKRSAGNKPFTFYDGPPFATGEPHYGHILAGTIKDVVTRQATQNGHYVERRFGQDTHGLPVEHEIDKTYNIKSRQDVLDMGIKEYNRRCREIVMRYSSKQEDVVTRCGRQIDFENDYKTMDRSFMESVQWVFKTIYDRGLVYQGYKVMPYSASLGTPLSNFEANLNYQDVSDPSVVISFPLVKDQNTKLLAQTTTPQTLPSNLALCVNPNFEYIKIKDLQSNEIQIIAESRLEQLYKKPKAGKHYEIVDRMKGHQLENFEYIPLFSYFKHHTKTGAFRVLNDDYVSSDSGTGIVHQAPGFGEDDYRICLKYGIIGKGSDIVCPIDANGHFTDEVSDFYKQHVKEADRDIIRHLKHSKRLIREQRIVHSYPFCWRSDTPLIYRAVPSQFVNVSNIKERLLACNEQTYWVPNFVKSKRFHNQLHDARDQAVSRNRFQGTPLPVQVSDDRSEICVIGSIKELEELSGRKDIIDLHRENIDSITIPSKNGKGVLRRVDEVFDCQFESGSMPYAQIHYPFENKDSFLSNLFPADFVAEGLDQTRGQFYTLMVLSTALFDKPAFKNLICNGLVLAEDGKKMSKRLKNYPPPEEIINKFGADALRVYLINSPVVRAEPLRFKQSGVFDVIKDLFLPWQNSYRFLVENAERYENNTKQKFEPNNLIYQQTDNILDKQIFASLQTLIERVRSEMNAYKLYEVMPHLVKFLNSLSLCYVRFNRERMKLMFGAESAQFSLQTLHHILISLCRLMAPFTPFLVEAMYQNLKRCFSNTDPLYQDSVHYLSMPEVDEKARDLKIELAVERLQSVIDMGRKAREERNLKTKQPLSEIIIVNPDSEYLESLSLLQNYVLQDLNVRKLRVSTKLEDFVNLKCVPDMRRLGKRLRGKCSQVSREISELKHEKVIQLQNDRKIIVCGSEIEIDDVSIEMEFSGDNKRYSSVSGDGGIVVLDTEISETLVLEGLAREFVNRIQKLRKKIELNPSIQINIFYQIKLSDQNEQHGECNYEEDILQQAVNKNLNYITSQTRQKVFHEKYMPKHSFVLGVETTEIQQQKCTIWLTKPCIIFSDHFKNEKTDDLNESKHEIIDYVISKNFGHLKNEIEKSKDGKFSLVVNNKMVSLQKNVDFFLEVDDYIRTIKLS